MFIKNGEDLRKEILTAEKQLSIQTNLVQLDPEDHTSKCINQHGN